MLAMAESKERRAFRFGWSVWRRAHQAIAARCHAARRAHGRDPAPLARTASLPERSSWHLTDAEWEAVRSLLPPQSPPVGRPRHDHRRVLGAILWVTCTQASWRDLPPECGKWATAYKRYRLWADTGLWTRLLTALGYDGDGEPGKVAL